MRNISLFLLLSLPFLSLAQEVKPFEIKAINAGDVKKIYLMYYSFDDDEKILDSAIVKDGRFSLKGEIKGVSYAGLLFREHINNQNERSSKDTWFYLHPGKTEIDFSKEDKVTGGSEEVLTYLAFKKEVDEKRDFYKSAEYLDKRKEIEHLLNQVKEKEEALNQVYGNPKDVFQKSKLDFIKNHPDNPLSLMFVSDLAGSKPNADELFPIFNSLSPELKSSKRGKRFETMLKGLAFVVGAQSVDFGQATPEGKTIKLSDLKGKYVLVDFWASWCVPCRQENPNIVKAYQQFKDKNFEILAVSLDNDKASWEKAIKDDKLTWLHISDLKGWKNEVAGIYAIRAVPSNFLIDPQGKIIAKNLRGEELEKVLSQVIK